MESNITVKDSKREKARSDWRKNHAVIHDAMLRLIKKLSRHPTQEELSVASGLSVTAISRHFENFDFGPIKKEYGTFTEDIIRAIIKSADKGNAASQKLFLQYVMDYVEKQKHELTGDLNVTIDIDDNEEPEEADKAQDAGETNEVRDTESDTDSASEVDKDVNKNKGEKDVN